MSRAAEGAADQLLHVSSQRLSTWAALWLAEMCLEVAPGLPPRDLKRGSWSQDRFAGGRS
jgi:hypothetical protein